MVHKTALTASAVVCFRFSWPLAGRAGESLTASGAASAAALYYYMSSLIDYDGCVRMLAAVGDECMATDRSMMAVVV